MSGLSELIAKLEDGPTPEQQAKIDAREVAARYGNDIAQKVRALLRSLEGRDE